MKKHIAALCLCAAASGLLLTGCAGTGSVKKTEAEAAAEMVTEAVTEEISDPAGQIRKLTLPDPSEYLIAEAARYVDLGETEGLSLVRSVYPVGEEEVEVEIDNRLYEYAELVTEDRAAEEYDTVTVDVTISVDGTDQTEVDYPVELGYEEFGSVFDETMIGHKAGDHLVFSQTFDEDSYQPDWTGKTVNFDVTVKAVQTYEIPELTDEWVSKHTQYDTVDSFRKGVEEELKKSNERQSASELRQMAVDLVVENSRIHDVPQELTVQAVTAMEDMIAQTAEMFGMTTEEMYDAFGYSDEILQEEAVSELNRRIVLSALAQQENIRISTEDLQNTALDLYEDAGYDSPQDLIDDYGVLDLSMTALETKAGEYLVSRAAIAEEYYDDTTEDLELDESYEAEDQLEGMPDEITTE